MDIPVRRHPKGDKHVRFNKRLFSILRITYDAEVDVLRIIFSNKLIEESDEDKPGIILDYDQDGNIVGIEILDASKRMENPRSLEYAVVK